MIYFISDTHFNHDKAFIWGPRGFKSVQEANDTIIKNWMETVTREDDIYVLGDFFLGKDMDYVKKTVVKLPGRIHLILGNHDSPAKVATYRTMRNIVEIVWATQIEYKGRQFYLSHYPTLTADLQSNPDRAVFNLFGHTHSKEKFFEERPYMYNVACDAQNCKPVSIDEVYSDIQQKIKECLSFLV